MEVHEIFNMKDSKKPLKIWYIFLQKYVSMILIEKMGQIIFIKKAFENLTGKKN